MRAAILRLILSRSPDSRSPCCASYAGARSQRCGRTPVSGDAISGGEPTPGNCGAPRRVKAQQILASAVIQTSQHCLDGPDTGAPP